MIVKEKLKQIESRLKELIEAEEYTIEYVLLFSEAIQLERIVNVQKSVSIDLLDMLLDKGLITIEQRENVSIEWDSIDPKLMEAIEDD